MNDPRQVAVEHALKVTSQRLLSREISIAEALAAVGTVLDGDPEVRKATPRELAAAGRRAYREGIVAEIVGLESEGRSRDAISIVVDRHVQDRLDPLEIASLTRKFHRWRGKKN